MSFSEKFKELFSRKEKFEKVATGNAKIDTETSFWERVKAKYVNMYFLKKLVWIIFRLVLLIGISYVIIYPYFSKVTTSLMAPEDFVDTTVVMIPRNWTLDTYKAIINDNKYFTAMFNTALLSLLCGVIQTLICSIVGYGFAKFKFKFKGALFLLVIFTMVVPHETIRQALILRFRYFDLFGYIPQINSWLYNFFEEAGMDGLKESLISFANSGWLKNLVEYKKDVVDGTAFMEVYSKVVDKLIPNLLNTYWPMAILSLTGLAFKNGLYIFMMRQYYNGVPDELEEAAYVDGAGVIKTFVRIILPMSLTMMVTIFMFSFSWQWMDTFYTEVFMPGGTSGNVLLSHIYSTIPTSLDTDYAGQAAYTTAIRNASGILILIPLLIMYLFGQRTLIEGVERSGITG